MANSSVEYWDIDGVSLNQYGWSITTIGGPRFNLPGRRGDNLQYAYTPGAIWRPKLAESRTISLAFFLTGMDPATGQATGDQILRWNDSWDFLRRLVWRVEAKQFALTRRQRLTIDGTEQLLVTTGLAEMANTMEPTMTGRTRADFAMDLLMADPYFYGPVQQVAIPVGQPVTVHNPGMDAVSFKHFTITVTGPANNVKIANLTFGPNHYLQWASSVSSGQSLILDCENFTATVNGNAVPGPTVVGSRRWMNLLPGNNLISFTTNSGGGSAKLTFQAPYV